jgi:hypothetical protein
MKATFRYYGRDFEITTEHAACHDGLPVLIVDSELTDVPVVLDDDPTDLDDDPTDVMTGDDDTGW